MALFNKKKKNIFLDLPRPNLNFPLQRSDSFPEYKPIIPDFSTIKSEINKPKIDEFDIEEEPEQPILEEHAPKPESANLFIKVSNYEQAMRLLEDIKDSFRKTEDILKNLRTIKQQEDKEIITWNSQIQKLKNKVISVESTLFDSKK